MANFSFQLQADNFSSEDIQKILVEGPWAHVITRLLSGENILLEGCRGVGKTMIMRAATERSVAQFCSGGKVLGVHATFRRYLATLPPPGEHNEEGRALENFRAWVNARILQALSVQIKSVRADSWRSCLGRIGEIEWNNVISVLETTYRGLDNTGGLLRAVGLTETEVRGLWGYTFTRDALLRIRKDLGIDLLILMLDDAAHALDTRAQGAFFTTVKSLYGEGLAYKISVYPAVTRYGIDFSYGHDAIVVPLGVSPTKDRIPAFEDLLRKRLQISDAGGREFIEAILIRREWVELMVYCTNGNPRGLLKLLAQVQTQLESRPVQDLRYEDIRTAINYVMDRHLDNMVPGIIKDLDKRLLKASELMLDDFRQRISDSPGPYEGGKPRCFLAVTNSLQVPYVCIAAMKLLVAANVINAEGPTRLSRRETGTLFMLHPGFIFRDNVIGGPTKGTLTADNWNVYFAGMSSRVHAEISKSAALWDDVRQEAAKEQSGLCENGHPMYDPAKPCEQCGAKAFVVSPVRLLLEKDIDVLELSGAIKQRLREHGLCTVRQVFEATEEDLDKVDYIGERRAMAIKSVVGAAVDEFVAG